MSSKIIIQDIKAKAEKAEGVIHEAEFDALCIEIDGIISEAAEKGWRSVRVDVKTDLLPHLTRKIEEEYKDFQAQYVYHIGDPREMLDYDTAYFNFYW